MYTSSKGEQKDPAEMDAKYMLNAFVKNLEVVHRLKALGYEESDAQKENFELAENNVLVLKEELLKRLYPIVEEKGI